jgi:hypothetical protein
MRLAAALLLVPALALAAPPLEKPAAAPQPALADARALVERVLAAYGGRPALEKARAVRQEGMVASSRRGLGRVVRLFERPGSLRVEIAYPGVPPEVRVVHAGKGDRGGREVTGTLLHASMLAQAARLGLPLSLAAADAKLVDGGAAERDGRRVRRLALSLPGELELTVEVDPESARIVRSAATLPGPGGGRVELATEYSDFRPVAGVLFAFHEESWASGQHTGATVLDRVEVLPAFPVGTFHESL